MSFSEIARRHPVAGACKREGLGNFDRGLSNSTPAQSWRSALRPEASEQGRLCLCGMAPLFDSPLSKFPRPSRLRTPAPRSATGDSEKLIFQFEFLFHHTSSRGSKPPGFGELLHLLE